MDKGFWIVAFSLLFFTLYKYYSFAIFASVILFASVIVMGYGSGMIQISGQTLLHLNSHEDKRGRVFAFSSMQLRLATTLPSLFVGAITDLTSAFITMALLSVLVFTFVIWDNVRKKKTIELNFVN